MGMGMGIIMTMAAGMTMVKRNLVPCPDTR
jgi:hypothetical protein